jgi:glutamate decarboxylase
MPEGLEDVHVLPVVVRNGFGRDLAHMFIDDLARAVTELEAGGGRAADDRRAFTTSHGGARQAPA